MKSEDEAIKGNKVSLRPATQEDRRMIYEWMANSDITSSMMGMPKFPDVLVPTWEEFSSDYEPYYFDGSKPNLGRCFIILTDGKPIGMVNYNEIDESRKRTELDIWMSSERNCGKEYGTDALETLTCFLYQEYGIVEFIMRPSARNSRAVHSYEKIGFHRIDISPEQEGAEFGPGNYYDSFVLVKRLPSG